MTSQNKTRLASLSEIAQIYNGNSINAKVKKEKYVGLKEGLPYIGTKDVGFDGTVNYDNGVRIPNGEPKFKTAPAGTVFVCAEGGSAGKKTALIDREVCFGNKLFAVVVDSAVCDPEYLYLFTRAPQFKEHFKALMGGLIGGVTAAKFGSIKIPLIPLEEQHQIIQQSLALNLEYPNLENQLLVLRKAILDYRNSIMIRAFSGQLDKQHDEAGLVAIKEEIQVRKKQSKKWEPLADIELPNLPAGWEWISIGDITNGVEYGTSSKSGTSGRVPVLRMGNIQDGIIDWSDLKYSSDEEEIQKYSLSQGDVLFNRTNSGIHVGKTAIFAGPRKALFAGYLIRINQFSCINPRYLTYCLNSPFGKQYANAVKADAVNQSNINGKKLCTFPFPVCSEETQESISAMLDAVFTATRIMLAEIDKTMHLLKLQQQSAAQEIFSKVSEG